MGILRVDCQWQKLTSLKLAENHTSKTADVTLSGLRVEHYVCPLLTSEVMSMRQYYV